MDNHNSLRHGARNNPQIGLESAWEPPGGPSKFSFFVACTEVIAYLMMKYFLNTGDTFMDFGGKLAKSLINNSYKNEETCDSPEKQKKTIITHTGDSSYPCYWLQ